ncbi:hypothetical protein [Pseudonocardia xishanensis]|uniref:hypothetical protein n=1 Tax=Pseudonocardia xishanensis TaxID=630995 RepID=UPI0031E841E8
MTPRSPGLRSRLRRGAASLESAVDAAAASILPGTSAALREAYAAYDHERRTQGMAASRPLEQNTRLITDLARTGAPAVGWSPG